MSLLTRTMWVEHKYATLCQDNKHCSRSLSKCNVTYFDIETSIHTATIPNSRATMEISTVSMEQISLIQHKIETVRP